jgi:hypothetical protein
MTTRQNETGQSKSSVSLITVVTTIVTVVIAGLISYYTARFQVEKQAAITLSFTREHFEARLKEYPRLWEILLPLSSRFPDQATPEKSQEIAQKLNQWMYGPGGLVAHEYTRSFVFQLREACAKWKSGERPKEISELKDDIIYSSRNDLYLVARENVDAADLEKLVTKRNDEIRRLRDEAKLFRE